MKKLTGLCIIMFCFAGLYSQVTLQFCASVEANGFCNFNNTEFIAAHDSTHVRIYMQVKSVGVPIGASNLTFKIYKRGKDGKETSVAALLQLVKPDWGFAWMPYLFDSPGKYVVRIYNEADKMICSNALEFIAFK